MGCVETTRLGAPWDRQVKTDVGQGMGQRYRRNVISTLTNCAVAMVCELD